MADRELINSTDKTPAFTIRGKFQAKCVKVYDGDTCHFVFRLQPDLPLYRFTIRMYGYNSAEIHGLTEEERDQAQQAKKALSDMILGKIVTLDALGNDKYGRVLANITYNEKGIDIDINKYMIVGGYGKSYYGEGEKAW